MSIFYKFIMLVYVSLFSNIIAAYDSNYQTEAEIPEPLLFDLVRRINSKQGELEYNILWTQENASELNEVHAAPEIEYAYADGKSIEFELPTANGKIQTFKGALQFELPNWLGDITGLQIIHEKVNGKSIHETTALLLIANRINDKWSALTMLGNQFTYGDSVEIADNKGRELPIINLNFFYDYADIFDLGLEMNLKGIGGSFEEFIFMPQIHALLKEDIKLQAGFGTTYHGKAYSPISAFRLIKEYN